MQEELNQFKKNNVWNLVHRPSNQHVIKTRWICRNKLNENFLEVRNKSRLFVQ